MPAPKHDLSFVLRVADLLEGARLRTWLFGGWAEELRGLRAPREHSDIDLLYPGRDFERVDRFIERAAAVGEAVGKNRGRTSVPSSSRECSSSSCWCSATTTAGSPTPAGGRHRWPADVFLTAGRLPVASEAALTGYRVARASDATRAA